MSSSADGSSSGDGRNGSMFRDQNTFLARNWTNINLLVASVAGAGVQAASQLLDACGDVARPLLLSSALIFPALCCLNLLQDRSGSIHLLLPLLYHLSLAILGCSCLITSLVYTCILVARHSHFAACAYPYSGDPQANFWIAVALGLLWNPAGLALLGSVVFSRIVFMRPPKRPIEWTHVKWLRTERGHLIPIRHFAHADATLTFLYSHGNAEDLATLFKQGKCLGLRDQLRVNVICYDYPGYGHASGTPDEGAINDAIESVYVALVDQFLTPPSSIVLYGRSMGSGPTCHLAKKLAEAQDANNKLLAGVILECPIASIYSTKLGCLRGWPGDLFDNLSKVRDIGFPILFVHGKSDTVVPFSHSLQLYEQAKLPSQPPYWVETAGHNNMPDVWQYRRPARRPNEKHVRHAQRVEATKKSNLLNTAWRERLLDFLREIDVKGGEQGQQRVQAWSCPPQDAVSFHLFLARLKHRSPVVSPNSTEGRRPTRQDSTASSPRHRMRVFGSETSLLGDSQGSETSLLGEERLSIKMEGKTPEIEMENVKTIDMGQGKQSREGETEKLGAGSYTTIEFHRPTANERDKSEAKACDLPPQRSYATAHSPTSLFVTTHKLSLSSPSSPGSSLRVPDRELDARTANGSEDLSPSGGRDSLVLDQSWTDT
eukprot:g17303.t1